MFAPQKSVNLTFFQRFVDYNWPTRKRTFRHILSQVSVGPSLCRSRSSRAPPKFPSETFRNFRNWLWIKKLRDQRKGCVSSTNSEISQTQGHFRENRILANFVPIRTISRSAGCQRRIISSLEGTARATLSTALLPTTLQAIPESHFVLHDVVVVATTENDMRTCSTSFSAIYHRIRLLKKWSSKYNPTGEWDRIKDITWSWHLQQYAPLTGEPKTCGMRQVRKQIFIKFYFTFNFSHDHKYFTKMQYSWNALPIKWQCFDNRRVGRVFSF